MRTLLTFAFRYLYAAASCIYLFGGGCLSRKHRPLLWEICRHFAPAKEAGRGVPKADLSELIHDSMCIQVCEPHAVDGNVSHFETVVIDQLVVARAPRKVFEIGTFDGRTTLNITMNCRDGATVYTLDLPRDRMDSTALPLASDAGGFEDRAFIDKPVSGARFLGTDAEKQIVQLVGDSATFDYSPYEGGIDFVFVDGSHSYEYVMNDSRTAIRLLREGKGIVLWHDYHVWEGVTRALDELHARGGTFAGMRQIKGTSLVVLCVE